MVMIQFSKELYDTGKYDVVYRNGKSPEFISFFSNGVITTLEKSGAGFFHNANGTVRNFSEQTNYDLFLIPKERWANRYKILGHVDDTWLGPEYSTKQEAIDNKDDRCEYIETVKLVSE